MVSFISALLLLVVGYFFYGKFVVKMFGVDANRPTPAITKADGVDYIKMPAWRIFMIQFLNIAGLGPIFGAIMGAKFGPAAYLWIVFGTIIAGATHDYVSGMISLREGGANLPDLIGKYLGNNAQRFMRVLTIILMIMVGAVFVSGPAGLLTKLTPERFDATFWICVIFAYYLLATLLPIDKIIGKVYPLFAIALLFMAFGIMGVLIWMHPELPEVYNGLENTHPSGLPIFPVMCVSIACGAISGFHATQSPMMARCMTNERQGHAIFYGAMVAEGVVAMVWAAAANYFYSKYGMEESNAAIIVDKITKELLGPFGCVLAMLGVIAVPITTGDTALRTARLITADMFKLKQHKLVSRLVITIPIFIITISVLVFSLSDAKGFETIWRYFSWVNQVLSCITLWTCTVYFCVRDKSQLVESKMQSYAYLLTLIPALFMTYVIATYILIAPEGFELSQSVSYIIGGVVSLAFLCWFSVWKCKIDKNKNAIN